MPFNRPNKIFLTSEEDERVRKTLKGKVQKRQELAGEPRVPGDPNERLNQVATAALMADFASTGLKTQKSGRDTIAAYAVGYPYPPCTFSLQDLKPMALSDLRMETHHRGRVLTVKRVAPVVKLVMSSWTVIEEESSGETERLEVLLHQSKQSQDILELASVFKIKDPFFTIGDQGPTLRIDHPSDLIVCMDGSPPVAEEAGPDKTAASTTLTTKTAKEWKEAGNEALKQRNLFLAHTNYSNGLELASTNGVVKEELAYDLFRNRSHVNLLLNHFDEAKADALSAVTGLADQPHKDLDSKAYSRAGTAAYNLGEFEEAKALFEKQQILTGGDKEATSRLRVAELRLREQGNGSYVFKKIKANLVARPRVDAASFTSNVKVAEAPGRGNGLIATRDIKLDDIILCEKAFCVVWGHEAEALTAMTYDGRDDRIRVFPAGLCKAVVWKLRDNPSQVGRVMGLYGDYPGIDKKLIMRDSSPVVDTFQVHDIIARNAFGPGPVKSGGDQEGEDDSNSSAGLWIMAAYANHSCVSNAKKESVGDLMVLRATRSIAAGEAITHTYDDSSDYDTRSAALMTTWGFVCDCALCIAEKSDDPTVRKKRRDLESEANVLIGREDPFGAKRLSIVKARRLARSITETYDEKIYSGLPRLALPRIQKWIAEATQ